MKKENGVYITGMGGKVFLGLLEFFLAYNGNPGKGVVVFEG